MNVEQHGDDRVDDEAADEDPIVVDAVELGADRPEDRVEGREDRDRRVARELEADVDVEEEARQDADEETHEGQEHGRAASVRVNVPERLPDPSPRSRATARGHGAASRRSRRASSAWRPSAWPSSGLRLAVFVGARSRAAGVATRDVRPAVLVGEDHARHRRPRDRRAGSAAAGPGPGRARSSAAWACRSRTRRVQPTGPGAHREAVHVVDPAVTEPRRGRCRRRPGAASRAGRAASSVTGSSDVADARARRRPTPRSSTTRQRGRGLGRRRRPARRTGVPSSSTR